MVASRGYRPDRAENTIPVAVYDHYLVTVVVYIFITYQLVCILMG
jgi:hypothetical protein